LGFPKRKGKRPSLCGGKALWFRLLQPHREKLPIGAEKKTRNSHKPARPMAPALARQFSTEILAPPHPTPVA